MFFEVFLTYCSPLLYLQVLVLFVALLVSAHHAGPTGQIEARADKTAAQQPAGGHRTAQPDGSQQHRRQLQPERQDHMRADAVLTTGTVTRMDRACQNC